MKKISIVLGLGFGDEGKGLTTSFLVSKASKPLVIRFSGGHQAGHTVVHEDKRHVFSSFGSGTLQEADTWWTKYCVFSPIAFLREHDALKKSCDLSSSTIYIDPLCPVTTPYDEFQNQQEEITNKHGSVGVGVGTTIRRQEDHYKLYYQDLFYPAIFKAKLDNIAKYYKLDKIYNKADIFVKLTERIELFKKYVEILVSQKIITLNKPKFQDYSDLIFEGSQGILLDEDFGFFPNVTRGNTTSKNAISILKEIGLFNLNLAISIEIFYVTRAYQTRHGNGFMTNKDWKLHDLKNNEEETNKESRFQGNFRTTPLDIDLINYAIMCDEHFSKGFRKNIIITCLDQKDEIQYTKNNGEFSKIAKHPKEIIEQITQYSFKEWYGSYGPSVKDIILQKIP